MTQKAEQGIPSTHNQVKSFEEYDFSFMKPPETRFQKLKRKVKSNPFIPIGMGLTVLALFTGFKNFYKGNQMGQQKMMRARIAAQGGTILALCAGFMLEIRNRDAEKEKE